jgi:hypothetical protein
MRRDSLAKYGSCAQEIPDALIFESHLRVIQRRKFWRSCRSSCVGWKGSCEHCEDPETQEEFLHNEGSRQLI